MCALLAASFPCTRTHHATQTHTGPGASEAATREFVVSGGYKGARCMLPYRHAVEACPGYHVLKVCVVCVLCVLCVCTACRHTAQACPGYHMLKVCVMCVLVFVLCQLPYKLPYRHRA